jgi:hypothetical protein
LTRIHPHPAAVAYCQVVYVARNPKDACVSAFFHNRSHASLAYDGPWDHFVDQ